MFAKHSLSQNQVQVPVFPSISASAEMQPKERILFLSHFLFLLLQEEKTERKTFIPFQIHCQIEAKSGRNDANACFFSLSSFSFQKKRRRKGVEEGDSFLPLFSLFFLSLPLLFREKKKRRRSPFFLSLSPFGRRVLFSFLFLFSFFFKKKRRKKNSFSF